jgi:hypothetical protein
MQPDRARFQRAFCLNAGEASVQGGMLDLVPGSGAQFGATESDIVEQAIVERFHAEQLDPIAKVAMNSAEKGGEQHSTSPKSFKRRPRFGSIAAPGSYELR